MANGYIPRPDARFHAWRNNFVTYVNGHLAELACATMMRCRDEGGRSNGVAVLDTLVARGQTGFA